MGSLLVVDGSGVCRAPIAAFLLRGHLFKVIGGPVEAVGSRGLTAIEGARMCDSAASRIGFSGPALAFYGAHRAAPLTVADVAAADLVLTAERAQRSAVVRMLPGTKAMVFTWKETLALSTVLVERRRTGALGAPSDLAALARSLHGARGTIPLVEPPVRTGVFHWRRGVAADPLTITGGHDGAGEHRRITQEAVDVADALGRRIAALMRPAVPELDVQETGTTRRGRRISVR